MMNQRTQVLEVTTDQAPLTIRTAPSTLKIYASGFVADGRLTMPHSQGHLAWGAREESMQHVIKYAESSDGMRWERHGHVAIPLHASGEFAVARPCVLHDDGRYRMWYSRRTPDYRMGYAESRDGLAWTRRDSDAGLAPSPGSWDGQSVEYACVFDADGERWMLYNGDDYGRAGFGLAMLVR